MAHTNIEKEIKVNSGKCSSISAKFLPYKLNITLHNCKNISKQKSLRQDLYHQKMEAKLPQQRHSLSPLAAPLHNSHRLLPPENSMQSGNHCQMSSLSLENSNQHVKYQLGLIIPQGQDVNQASDSQITCNQISSQDNTNY